MNIIFSNWNISNLHKDEIHMAQLANFLAQKQGYKTTLFCEEEAQSTFKNIPYNEIKILPKKIMQEIPPALWSMSKIVALSLIDKPSLVIDFDLFLFNKLDKKRLDNDIVYFHDEPYSHCFVDPLLEWFENLKFNKIKHLPEKSFSHNCAMIGGQDFKFIKDTANEIIEDVISKKEEWLAKTNNESSRLEFNSKFYPGKEDPFFVPVLIVEQVWMFDLYKYYNKKYTPYFERSDDYFFKNLSEGIFHLWGLKSQHVMSISREFVNSHVDYKLGYKDFKYNKNYLKEIRQHLNI